MKKTAILSLLFAFSALVANATFPVRRTISHRQSTGQTVEITSVGNGRYTLYTDANGRAVLPQADGNYYYAERTADGNLAPSSVLVGQSARSTQAVSTSSAYVSAAEATELLNALYPVPTTIQKSYSLSSFDSSTSDGLGSYGKSGKGTVSSIGSPVIPVVMVNFADKSFREDHTQEKLTRFFNEEGYHDEPLSCGSVADYFKAQSYGIFSPQFKVVAEVTLSQGYAYYGKDGSNGSTDSRSYECVTEALKLASETVDFSQYCTEGTTSVPLVALMYAGPGQQSSFEDGRSDYLWAKYREMTFKLNDGKCTTKSYLLANELFQVYGTSPNDILGANLDGVGLFAHEFGHAIGLPDYYDTKTNGKFKTLGYWDMMDYGQYTQEGYQPTEYTAYERSYMGWLKIEELTDEKLLAHLLPLNASESEAQAYNDSVAALDDTPQKAARAFMVRNPEAANEYYIFENKQPGTWFTKDLGAGMLVTHVDYNASSWANNRVNIDSTHIRMDVLRADNIKDGNTGRNVFLGYQGDLFPGTKGVTSLTDDTTPATTLFNGESKKLSRPLYNIALNEQTGIVSFGYLDATITGIRTVENASQPLSRTDVVYSLDGRILPSLGQAPSGVYIVNGRKVVK